MEELDELNKYKYYIGYGIIGFIRYFLNIVDNIWKLIY